MSDILKNKVEPTWTYPDLLKQHEKVTESKFKDFDKKLNKEITKLTRLVDVTSSQYEMRLDKHLNAQTKLIEELNATHIGITADYTNKINKLQEEITTEIEKQSVELNNLINKVNQIKIQSDIQSTGDILLRITNSTGETQKIKIKQFDLDNDTICLRNYKLALKYVPDEETFKRIGTTLSVQGLKLSDGKILTGESIQDELRTNQLKISDAISRVDAAISRLDNKNGYVVANNFKNNHPTNQQLTDYVLSCLSSSLTVATTNDIPNGTRVKNLFDNHIWVLNRITSDGLTTLKWEDFGVDSIGIANNNGTCGIVSGSKDTYRGFVDVNGVISINGLEETLTQILTSITNIQNEMIEFKQNITAKLNDLENKN